MSNENTKPCAYAMSQEVQHMCTVAHGPNHGPAPLPEEGKWIQRGRLRIFPDIPTVWDGALPSREPASCLSTSRTVSLRRR